VYRTTGAYIHDKHFEVVLRQMLRYVQVETPGDSELLPDDLIDRFTYTESNALIVAQGGEPATARPVLLSLVRTALATQGWLAAASFQQTSQVLTDAALEGRVDHLYGLKENVIVGKMIPAGTGLLARSQDPARQIPRRRGRPPKKL
jgi:DNA-directed RNA polymerase subunit beta'